MKMCEECDEELQPYVDPNTGREGLSCDSCGWSWDDEPEERKAEPTRRPAKPRFSKARVLAYIEKQINDTADEYGFDKDEDVLVPVFEIERVIQAYGRMVAMKSLQNMINKGYI